MTARPPYAGLTWLLTDPVAGLWLRPWFDTMSLWIVTRWIMPLSRAWATALESDGDPARFWRELPGDGAPPVGLRPILARLSRRHRKHREADLTWTEAFFGTAPMDERRLRRAERRRRRSAERMMIGRTAFVPLALRRRLPPVKWDMRAPAEVEAQHGHRLATPEAAFPPPEMPEVTRSRSYRHRGMTHYWLRFASPADDSVGTVWARVLEPIGVADPPTMIYLHGLCVEREFWREFADPVTALVERGVRVVQPEGPWHGRRRRPGTFGGEPALARAPVGMIETLSAWVAETAVLVAWAHGHGSGAVGVGGTSLGALTSQLAATAARHWPAEMQPEAMLLVTTSGDANATFLNGSLPSRLGLTEQLAAAGWTEAETTKWLALMEPRGAPAMGADRVIMVLGRADDVTPYDGGVALADRWGVPADNRFVSYRGHFSAAIASGGPPFDRLLQVLLSD